MSTALGTSSFTFAFNGVTLIVVLVGIVSRTSSSKYALKYKVDWSSKVGITQVAVICMALIYTLWKLLQSAVGANSDSLCTVLCKLSAFSFPMIDFAVYIFLRIRNEKSLTGDESKRRKMFERVLFTMTFVTPILAILNAVYGDGALLGKTTKSCVTQPYAPIALTVSFFEIVVNVGFLFLFIMPLRMLARERSALDSKRVSEISRRNFISCLLCVTGGVFTNTSAAILSLVDSVAPSLSPFLVFGSVLVVIGVLFSTWKAWEWPVFGIGKAHRVVDENGDARPSEPAAVNDRTQLEDIAKPSHPDPNSLGVAHGV
eukprot:TRINITY_DN670_c0_g1_i1.p1 TRINITY_DN670_c0_g1~~TRINITY_DN670_c0_g1_i1.p1  ORF type:complete len:316 (-),score=64.22 TRINITY_DN670_c0_g1_i1:432-1379(-)